MEVSNRVVSMAADIMENKINQHLLMIKQLQDSNKSPEVVERLKKEVRDTRRAVKHMREREGCWY